MNLISELAFYEDALIVESQLGMVKEFFKKYNKTGITIQQVIDKILHYPMGAVKDILAKIDFTKEYSDSDIDKLLITLKDKLDALRTTEPSRSLEDILRNKAIEKMREKGQKFTPTYLGV